LLKGTPVSSASFSRNSLVSVGNDTATRFDCLVSAIVTNEVSAGMAYSSRLNLQLAANAGGKVYIPFKKSATERAAGSALWKKMFHYFRLNYDKFREHYHKRSNIEATNAAIKRKFGETLKSKNPTAQVNELLVKIVAYSHCSNS